LIKINLIILVIGSVFGLIAAVMAFLTTYEEYTHHFLDKKEPFRLGMRTAVFTFIVFVVLSILAGVILSKMV